MDGWMDGWMDGYLLIWDCSLKAFKQCFVTLIGDHSIFAIVVA